MPVSDTMNRNFTAASARSSTTTSAITSPRSVNLMALPTRLINT